MKTLVKSVIIILASLLWLQSNAQTFSFMGGLNLANMLMKDDEEKYSEEYKMNPGFHVGGTVDFAILESLSFETGLVFDKKGFIIKENQEQYDYVVNYNLYYLDIPILLKETIAAGDNVNIGGSFGPYIGVGLTGKMKWKVEHQGETETDDEKIEWGNDPDNDMLKRFDFGLGFGAGVEINSFFAGLSYDLGLVNISPDKEDGFKAKNRVLRITVGYRFMKK
jgi:hypothetical protein